MSPQVPEAIPGMASRTAESSSHRSSPLRAMLAALGKGSFLPLVPTGEGRDEGSPNVLGQPSTAGFIAGCFSTRDNPAETFLAAACGLGRPSHRPLPGCVRTLNFEIRRHSILKSKTYPCVQYSRRIHATLSVKSIATATHRPFLPTERLFRSSLRLDDSRLLWEIP
ncbi:hypothetical protein A6X21_11965 [Planctopirus hydrillae]|uniref:Uncharacterized protein n=1 Tax=Planctopirus hydrillae TaxID=1841610 RepID=A0A1C3E597_9PLAN|nr:hypothetical protein A6X21_11965 [Planctopirus hydrillae]